MPGMDSPRKSLSAGTRTWDSAMHFRQYGGSSATGATRNAGFIRPCELLCWVFPSAGLEALYSYVDKGSGAEGHCCRRGLGRSRLPVKRFARYLVS